MRYHVNSIAGLRRKFVQVRERLGTLLDLRLDKGITQAEYDEKARALKVQQTEIATRIEQHERVMARSARRWRR